MGKYIVKMTDKKDRPWYFFWSSIVDSPVSIAMTLDELKEHYQQEYGRQGMSELDRRLERVEKKGTSAHGDESAEDTIVPCNRAGKNETRLTAEQQLELVIAWREDTSYEIEGVDQDLMCCRCGEQINGEADRVWGDDDECDPLHRRCAEKRVVERAVQKIVDEKAVEIRPDLSPPKFKIGD